jgi:hypothetical protein
LSLTDVPRGLALAVGVLPAAVVGLAPKRRGRLVIPVLGTSIGVPIFIGGLLAGVPVLAVAAIGLFGVGSAMLTAHSHAGQIAMTLSLPMVGVELSYPDIGKAAAPAARRARLAVRVFGVDALARSAPPLPRPPARSQPPPPSPTGSASAPSARRQRRSASCSTSSMSAGRAPPSYS